jgi:hypothetical protein
VRTNRCDGDSLIHFWTKGHVRASFV